MKRVILVLLLIGLVVINGCFQQSSEDILTYFRGQMRKIATERVGQPYEEFTPTSYLKAFNGLKEKDFNGVEASCGVWKFKNDELRFVETFMVHYRLSAKTGGCSGVSVKGMNTLLENLSNRFNMDIVDKSSIDSLIEKIDSGG